MDQKQVDDFCEVAEALIPKEIQEKFYQDLEKAKKNWGVSTDGSISLRTALMAGYIMGYTRHKKEMEQN